MVLALAEALLWLLLETELTVSTLLTSADWGLLGARTTAGGMS
jgi:hypothetical protein